MSVAPPQQLERNSLPAISRAEAAGLLISVPQRYAVQEIEACLLRHGAHFNHPLTLCWERCIGTPRNGGERHAELIGSTGKTDRAKICTSPYFRQLA